jgi:hypothetical protein
VEVSIMPGSFVARYARETEGFAIHSVGDDEFFSWCACDTCGEEKGGTRVTCVLTNPGKHAHRIVVRSCTDCVAYAANGTIPDESEES